MSTDEVRLRLVCCHDLSRTSIRAIAASAGIPAATLADFFRGSLYLSSTTIIRLARVYRTILPVVVERAERVAEERKREEQLRRCPLWRLRALEKARRVSLENRQRYGPGGLRAVLGRRPSRKPSSTSSDAIYEMRCRNLVLAREAQRRQRTGKIAGESTQLPPSEPAIEQMSVGA